MLPTTSLAEGQRPGVLGPTLVGLERSGDAESTSTASPKVLL